MNASGEDPASGDELASGGDPASRDDSASGDAITPAAARKKSAKSDRKSPSAPPAKPTAQAIDPQVLSALAADWQAAWPAALASWSSYTQLRAPLLFDTTTEAESHGLTGSFAAIRLTNQTVMINLAEIHERKLERFAAEILAHEIGHHVYVPGNLSDNARMIAIIRPVLFGLPADTAHYVANLYGDLLLNDRLQRSAGLDMAGVYRELRASEAATEDEQKPGRVWQLYMRTYEHLWRLPFGLLALGEIDDETHADAALVARLIRHYAAQWLGGVRRFTSILYPYLKDDAERDGVPLYLRLGLGDCRHCGRAGRGACDADAVPGGLTEIGDAESESGDDDFDRELERSLGGKTGERVPKSPNAAPTAEGEGTPGRQHREPFQYGELLRALGLELSDHEITARYYRERALPSLIPFPTRRQPRATEPLPEGYDAWDAGEDLADLDLFGSLLRSPTIVPGVTTVQRIYGESPGQDPARQPLDLDIYVDCSGSMPNPAVNVSYLALAGAILALSALRAGARVQATLWSGPRQFDTTAGFIRDEQKLMGILTGYIAGSTAFPLHVLRETYRDRKASDPKVHIVVISDDGVDTILDFDEQKRAGDHICRQALAAARGGATLVLNLAAPDTWKPRATLAELGFRIHAVQDWEQLIAFARNFVRENYGE